MPHVDLVMRSETPASYRVARVQGMFDLPTADHQETRITVDVPLETLPEWQLGAIVGASGRGKTSIARHLFGPEQVMLPDALHWDERPMIEGFPSALGVQEIVALLVGVGLSSAPVWLRPWGVCSTGERFRASMARLLVENRDPLVIDEFTSVVDRVVARAVSVALARLVRRHVGRRLVVISCHKDILPWLDPDWVLDLDSGSFFRRGAHERPGIRLRLYPGSPQAWPLFRGYHYLTGALKPQARVFLATVAFGDEIGIERLAGFFSVLPAMGMRGWLRGHRTVVLPDFQGLGIGNRMIEETADWLWEQERKRFRATTSAPALIAHRRRHPDLWQLVAGPRNARVSGNRQRYVRTSAGRLSTSWVYLPRALRRVDQSEGETGELIPLRIEDTQPRQAGRVEVIRHQSLAGENLGLRERAARPDAEGNNGPDRQGLPAQPDRVRLRAVENGFDELLFEPQSSCHYPTPFAENRR